jgi:hypothetical protein
MDSHYFRARAQRCLDIAKQISDRVGAEKLHVQATEYQSRAAKLEAAESRTEPPSSERE